MRGIAAFLYTTTEIFPSGILEWNQSMETRFQTSFIPKKPIVSAGTGARLPREHRSVSFFMTGAAFLFIISLAAAGGAYAWKQILLNSQEDYKVQLADREKQFNIDLIEQLKQENVKIDLAKSLLANHLAISQIFHIISQLTIQSVRFLSLDVTAPTTQSSSGLNISLNGVGTSFESVAFQSDVLGQLEQYGLRKVVKNPILSNPALNGDGTVSFGFTATIDPSSVSYENSVAPQQAASPAASSTQTQ
jgi:hypothetical protein